MGVCPRQKAHHSRSPRIADCSGPCLDERAQSRRSLHPRFCTLPYSRRRSQQVIYWIRDVPYHATVDLSALLTNRSGTNNEFSISLVW